MKHFQKGYWIFGMGCLFLCCGCAQEVFIDLPEEAPRMVVVSHFQPKQPFRVKVSLSQSAFSNTAPTYPEGVDLSVSKNGQFFSRFTRKVGPDGIIFWESRDTVQEQGGKFAMVAKLNGYPTVEASSSMPYFIGLEPFNIVLEEIQNIELGNGRRELRVPIQMTIVEREEDSRYFAFRLSHEVGVYDLSELPPALDYTYVADSTFFLADGRTLALLHNIAEPVVLINKNFWNEGRRTLSITARLPYDSETEIPQRIFVEWRTLSEEFYKYHLSLSRQGSTLPLSEPDAVFNNVINGYGNFSGYSSNLYTINLPF